MNRKLLHFSADWCNPCKMMEPIIKLFLEENPDIQYQKIDVDNEFDLARKYDVMSVPTFIGMINDEVSNKVTGAVPKAKIEALFAHAAEPHFESNMIKETDSMGREMFWKDAGRP
jgi:thioredoxin 1